MGRGRWVAIVVFMVVAAACGGGDEAPEEDGGAAPATTTTSATSAPGVTTTVGAAPTTTVAATSLTLRITDVRLINSEESDSGMRVLLPAGVDRASVTVTGLPSPNRVISVCQAQALDRRMTAAACRMPENGEAVTVTLGSAASGVEVVQAGVSAPGPAGNSTLLDEVAIRYSASSREVNARLPQLASGESARPTFAISPASTDGAYRARLTWTVIQVFGGTASNAQLEVVQGTTTVNQASGGALDLRLEGRLASPGEAAVRAQNAGTAALVNPTLSLLLP